MIQNKLQEEQAQQSLDNDVHDMESYKMVAYIIFGPVLLAMWIRLTVLWVLALSMGGHLNNRGGTNRPAEKRMNLVDKTI
jgi:hypothetical protein